MALPKRRQSKSRGKKQIFPSVYACMLPRKSYRDRNETIIKVDDMTKTRVHLVYWAHCPCLTKGLSLA